MRSRSGRFAGAARRLLVAGLAFAIGCGAEGGPTPRDGAADSIPANANGTPVHIVDAAGRSRLIDAPPERILSLVPAATAILLELGVGERLVGRTDFDGAPELAHLPSVGGGLGPSLEVLVVLRPELVVRYHGPSDPETGPRLDGIGIPHIAVRPDTLGDVFAIARLLGEVTGRTEEAEAVVRRMRAELDEVATTVSGAPRPRVAIVLGGDPPWVASRGTFLHELVEIAGGENIFGDVGPLHAPVAVEEILRRDPDLLIMTEAARVPPGLRDIPVLRAPSAIQLPGPDVGASARAIARLLHPDRVP